MNVKREHIIFLGLCLAVMLLPVFYYAAISIPFADEIAAGTEMPARVEIYGGYFFACLSRVAHYWLHFGGYYFSVFVDSLFQPMVWPDFLIRLRVFNISVDIVFYFSLFFLLKEIFYRKKGDIAWIMSIYTILVFWIINNHLNTQTYTWYTCFAVYIVPLTTMLIGIGLFFRFIRTGKMIFGCLSAVLGFLASGGQVNVSFLNCGLFFMAMLYDEVQSGSRKWKERAIVAVVWLGGILNAIAPGNYARHDRSGADYPIVHALLISVGEEIARWWYFVSKTPYVILCILLFVICISKLTYDYSGKITYNHPIAMGGLLILFHIGVVFLYVLGTYHVKDDGSSHLITVYEDRVRFVQDLSCYLLTLFWIIYFAGFIKKHFSEFGLNKTSEKWIYLVCLLMFIPMLGMRSDREITTIHMIQDIWNGRALEYSNYQESILKQLEESPEDEDEVIVYYNSRYWYDPDDILIRGLELTDKEDSWRYGHNRALASLYNKKKVTVVFEWK